MELVKQGKYVDVADLRTDVPHDIASIVRKMIGNGFTADYNNCRYLLSDVRRLKKYRHHYNAVHIVRDWATASIGDFQLVMNKIFGVLNSARRPQDLFIRLASSMGRTNSDLLDYTEATDPKKLEDARHQAATSVARTFGWLCSLATALGIDLTSAVWRKFPGTCPYCQEHHTTESVCSMRRKDALDMWLLQEVANDNVASMPQSLREWEVMFRKVYPSTKANDIEFFSRKLIEELGEVADYIGRPNRRMEALRETGVDFLAFELADIFGWLCQCSTAVRPADLSEEKSAIAGEFEERMRGEICSFCYNAICTCDPELETRPGRLGEYRFLAGLSSLP